MKRKMSEGVSAAVLDGDTELVEFGDMELIITQEDRAMCSLFQPLGIAKGIEGPKTPTNRRKGRTDRRKSEERVKVSIPGLAESRPKETALREGRFFVWLDEMKTPTSRPVIWRVCSESVAQRWSHVRDEDDKAVYESGTKRGVVPYFEEEAVMVLEAEEENKTATITFPEQDQLNEAKQKLEFAQASKAAEESAQNDDQKLTSTLFGNLASSNLSPPKKRYVNDMLKTKTPTKSPLKEKSVDLEVAKGEKVAEETKEEKAARMSEGECGVELPEATDDVCKEEVEAEAFVTAIFAKAVRNQAVGEILEKVDRITTTKIEELEDSISGNDIKNSCLLYGSHTAKEMGSDRKRRCAACKARSKAITSFSFEDPAKLDGVRRSEPVPDFVVHFVCSDKCFPKIQALLGLIHFRLNCMNRVKRRWAMMVADEAEADKPRENKALFQALCADAKLRAGLHKSYLDLLKRCA